MRQTACLWCETRDMEEVPTSNNRISGQYWSLLWSILVNIAIDDGHYWEITDLGMLRLTNQNQAVQRML